MFIFFFPVSPKRHEFEEDNDFWVMNLLEGRLEMCHMCVPSANRGYPYLLLVRKVGYALQMA